MILFDTETTGLPRPSLAPLSDQPYIIELAMLKLDDITLEELESFHTLIRPPIQLPAIITKITGLTDADLDTAKPFIAHYDAICAFVLGEGQWVAHNFPFDHTILQYALRRIGKEFAFPWPCVHTCTAELSKAVSPDGRFMKQDALYEFCTGAKANQTHRALDDVRQLATIVRTFAAQKLL